ncbi:ABC transporter C family member 10 [Vitis vinifera]|uniref:ABC transporter C family member 10 n=1 Tax=Vitis vinifera TaxID=29760 RepID=A0A438H706_VITVI|nr:ABC transporter C family member 10 [Vitis vinifera]
MDPYRYREVIENYSLVKDIEMLPFSDLTGIRERDVNLSCGQKQRVQLACALYQDANGYLLDDPFSTVDAHSATSLFNLWPRICNGSSIKQDNYDNTWENDTNGGKEGALTKDVIPQRVAKAKDQLVKQQKKNRRIEMENLMYQCQAGENGLQDMSIKDSSDLMWFIDDWLKAVGHKMEYFHHQAPQPGGAAAPAAVPVVQKTPLEVVLESLENQMLMDVAPKPPDSLVIVGYPEAKIRCILVLTVIMRTPVSGGILSSLEDLAVCVPSFFCPDADHI